MSERILMAVDPSSASERLLDYVVRMVSGRSDPYLHLMHVQAPAPLTRKEPTEGTREPGRIGREDIEGQARGMLEDMRSRLTAAGIEPEHVDTGILTIGAGGSIVDGIIDAARDQQCSTIAVGRNSLPWYREFFHHHPADELVKKAHGYTLWIVE